MLRESNARDKNGAITNRRLFENAFEIAADGISAVREDLAETKFK